MDVEALGERLRRGLELRSVRAVLALISPKGGVGKSTLAASLAWILSSTPTVLVDADPSRVSSSLLRANCAAEEPVVCGREDGALVDVAFAEPDASLIEQLLSEYRVVVVDTPPMKWGDRALMDLLAVTDAVLLVSDATERARREVLDMALAIKNTVNPPPIIRTIINRGSVKDPTFTVIGYIPAVERAMANGGDVTALAKASKWSRAVRRIAAELVAELAGRPHTRRTVLQ